MRQQIQLPTLDGDASGFSRRQMLKCRPVTSPSLQRRWPNLFCTVCTVCTDRLNINGWMGFHPGFTNVKRMYDANQVAPVEGLGILKSNFTSPSHHEILRGQSSTGIWLDHFVDRTANNRRGLSTTIKRIQRPKP